MCLRRLATRNSIRNMYISMPPKLCLWGSWRKSTTNDLVAAWLHARACKHQGGCCNRSRWRTSWNMSAESCRLDVFTKVAHAKKTEKKVVQSSCSIALVGTGCPTLSSSSFVFFSWRHCWRSARKEAEHLIGVASRLNARGFLVAVISPEPG